jgi:predicted aminopeptidase
MIRKGVVAVLVALGLAGCAQHGQAPAQEWVLAPGYYLQSVGGHLDVLRAARPIDDWLSDSSTPEALRRKLALAQRLRAFASDVLALPDNPSYTRYADLGRKAAVWNVVAAPKDGLTLRTWCYPFVGCQGYRGYYDEGQARAFAQKVPADWDVAVYPVPAYSTLGWLNWAGGDPLLSSFIGYPEGELARIVFHELAHQVVYVPQDTVFNESFATAVERLGGDLWLQRHASSAARAEYAAFDARRQAFRALMRQTRQRLENLYASGASAQDKSNGKAEILDAFRAGYATLKVEWGGYAGYDPWVAQANNALFAVQAAYDEQVPAFLALFEREGRDFHRFFDAVRALARQPKGERLAALRELVPANASGAVPPAHSSVSISSM